MVVNFRKRDHSRGLLIFPAMNTCPGFKSHKIDDGFMFLCTCVPDLMGVGIMKFRIVASKHK